VVATDHDAGASALEEAPPMNRKSLNLTHLLCATLLSLAPLVGAQQAYPQGVQPSYPSQPTYPNTVVDTPAQARLMARRAAIADAQRQLSEIIFGARIDSQTYVRDFVTQSDTINSSVRALLQGAQVRAERNNPDGTVEVDMFVPVWQVQQALGRPVMYTGDEFRATGVGAPNPVAQPAMPGPYAPTPAPAYDWRLQIITAKGVGVASPQMANSPQGYAMARRAAQLDAYRNLGEAVMGVRVDSNTFVRNFVTVSDEISTRFNGFIQGAQVVESKQLPDGTVEVTIQIALNSLGEIVLVGQQELAAQGKYTMPNPNAQPAYPPQGYQATGTGAYPPSQQPPPPGGQYPPPAPSGSYPMNP